MARIAFRQSKNKRVHGAVCTQEETCCLEAWTKAFGQTTAVGVEECGQLDAWTKGVGQTTAIGVDECGQKAASRTGGVGGRSTRGVVGVHREIWGLAQPFDTIGSKDLVAYFTRRTFWFECGVSVAGRLHDQESRSVLECRAPGQVDKLLLSMDRPIPQPLGLERVHVKPGNCCLQLTRAAAQPKFAERI